MDLTSDPSESEGSRHPFGHDLMYQALETLGTNLQGFSPLLFYFSDTQKKGQTPKARQEMARMDAKDHKRH